MRARVRWPWLISGLTFLTDQLSKYAVVSFLQPGQSLPLAPPVLHLTYVQNTGAAFGLFRGWAMLFVAASVVIIGWIVRQLLRPGSPWSVSVLWGYGLVLGGAAGNLLDRVRLGHVIDFLDLRVWPVFNVGDSAITVGVALLILHSLRHR